MPKRPPDELLAQVRAEWVQAWRDLEHVEPFVVQQADGGTFTVDMCEHRPAILRSIAALDMGPPEGVNVAQHIANNTPGLRES